MAAAYVIVVWRHPETGRTARVEGWGATETAALADSARRRDALGLAAYNVRHQYGKG